MPTITIYSTPTCHFCHLAKDFFNAHNLSYTEYNIAENQEKKAEMIEKTGQMGVPVITINDAIVVGFNEEAIMELIEAETKATAN